MSGAVNVSSPFYDTNASPFGNGGGAPWGAPVGVAEMSNGAVPGGGGGASLLAHSFAPPGAPIVPQFPPPVNQQRGPNPLDNDFHQPPPLMNNASEWGTKPPELANADVEKHLFSTTGSGINFDNYENIPVEVSGQDVPQEINSFYEATLHPWIKENVARSQYSKPTPVQKYSIPTLLAERDLMSCAQTGSGKTAAFLLPIIHHIVVRGPPQIMPQINGGRRTYFPLALVLAPTRELSIQIHKEAGKFSYRTNLTIAILYGGRENYRDQITKLRQQGAHILIATPGRLLDILDQGLISLSQCQYVVLDEADRMLDMGFEPQIRKIIDHGMPPKTQRTTAMFSATFPKEIQVLAQDFLKQDYVFLAVGRVGSTSENIAQIVEWVDEQNKRQKLMQLLDEENDQSLVLVFVETKRGANDLTFFLQRNGYRAVAIHGDLKQMERERNLEQFRQGTFNILVATAVAARGLDIPNVMHVINCDLPTDIDEYVHRIGRTGRVGNLGKATSFFNDKNRGLGRDLCSLMTEVNGEVPDWLRQVASEHSGGGNTRYRGRGRGGHFGGTDHRRGMNQRFMNGANTMPAHVGQYVIQPQNHGAANGFPGGFRPSNGAMFHQPPPGVPPPPMGAQTMHGYSGFGVFGRVPPPTAPGAQMFQNAPGQNRGPPTGPPPQLFAPFAAPPQQFARFTQPPPIPPPQQAQFW